MVVSTTPWLSFLYYETFSSWFLQSTVSLETQVGISDLSQTKLTFPPYGVDTIGLTSVPHLYTSKVWLGRKVSSKPRVSPYFFNVNFLRTFNQWVPYLMYRIYWLEYVIKNTYSCPFVETRSRFLFYPIQAYRGTYRFSQIEIPLVV